MKTDHLTAQQLHDKFSRMLRDHDRAVRPPYISEEIWKGLRTALLTELAELDAILNRVRQQGPGGPESST